MHLAAVEAQARQRFRMLESERDAFGLSLTAPLANDFAYGFAYVRRMIIGPARAAVFKQLFHQTVEMIRLRHNHIHEGLHAFSIFQQPCQRAERRRDAAQRIANFVSHARYEFAHNCQLLSDDKLLRESLLLCDIFDDAEIVGFVVRFIRDRAYADACGHALA